VWTLLTGSGYAGKDWPAIDQGVNLDFSTTEVNKIGYDPHYYDVFKAAGFDSVRFFVKQGHGPEAYKEAIDGAINRGLTVVITGFTGKVHGKASFVEYWRDFAEFYQMYPKELVFEPMNEPLMAGHPNEPEFDRELMTWLNDVVLAIRATNPTRVIALGGPNYNHADMLVKYVTPEYLNYRLPDGTGFEEDENIWGIFHHYKPSGFSHSQTGTTLEAVNPEWKKEVLKHFELADKWAKKHKKKVLLSEWGTRLHNDRDDMITLLSFMTKEAAKRDIDWMYYCGVFNNAWTFSLYTSEWGFERTADIVEVLTGQKPELMVLPTNQLNNSEFMMDTLHWYSNGQVTLGTADGQGVDGSGALRSMVMFVDPEEPVIYQETKPDWRFYSEGWYMLQLREGNTYNISFYAKSATGKTKLCVQLGNAGGDPVLWTSEPVEINSDLVKYEFTYLHEAESVENARFSIVFSDRHSTVLLDNIKLIGSRP
jgi:hypothetical protein